MPLAYPPFKSCPCGSGRSYASCCQPAHLGRTLAETPERLMRARYSAFFLHDEAFLRASWYPDSRPAELNLRDGTRYLSLTIHEASGSEVEFSVRLKLPGGSPYTFRERSHFVRVGGQWLYQGGEMIQ